MSAHSPGPWRWSERPSEQGALLDANGARVAVGVGDVSNYGCTIDEYIRVHEDADARLLEAAPELLKALKDWIAWLDEVPGECASARERESRALIARIEGTPP